MVSRLSTEVEYQSLVATITKLVWLQALLTELQLPYLRAPTIYCDNLNVVILIANPILHSMSKHFKLDFLFVCDKAIKKLIHVSHIPSYE